MFESLPLNGLKSSLHSRSAAPSVSAVSLVGPDATLCRVLAGQTEDNLQKQVLAKWYPAAVDEANGGFFQTFGEDWTHAPETYRSLVYQARLTWVAAEAALRLPPQAAAYRATTKHGLSFLQNELWDHKEGGWHWAIDNGHPTTDRGTQKHVYGISFGIYAACAAFRATRDLNALRLAQRAFHWLEAHAHDAVNSGYYEVLTREGKPILTPQADVGKLSKDAIGTDYGRKSMNTHIHLLESFTALYEVWPDAHLRARLEEVFYLVRDRIVVEPGCLCLYFSSAWQPVPGRASFGHDVETAFLLTEAATVLGRPDDGRTWAAARRLVDHALDHGWDTEQGGFYDHGPAPELPLSTEKVWWTQAEGLNALLLLHAHFGRETPRYWDAFQHQWSFIQKYQTDAIHGGWYNTVTAAGVPLPGQNKSDAWTEAYHQARALFHVTATLRHLAAEEK